MENGGKEVLCIACPLGKWWYDILWTWKLNWWLICNWITIVWSLVDIKWIKLLLCKVIVSQSCCHFAKLLLFCKVVFQSHCFSKLLLFCKAGKLQSHFCCLCGQGVCVAKSLFCKVVVSLFHKSHCFSKSIVVSLFPHSSSRKRAKSFPMRAQAARPMY